MMILTPRAGSTPCARADAVPSKAGAAKKTRRDSRSFVEHHSIIGQSTLRSSDTLHHAGLWQTTQTLLPSGSLR